MAKKQFYGGFSEWQDARAMHGTPTGAMILNGGMANDFWVAEDAFGTNGRRVGTMEVIDTPEIWIRTGNYSFQLGLPADYKDTQKYKSLPDGFTWRKTDTGISLVQIDEDILSVDPVGISEPANVGGGGTPPVVPPAEALPALPNPVYGSVMLATNGRGLGATSLDADYSLVTQRVDLATGGIKPPEYYVQDGSQKTILYGTYSAVATTNSNLTWVADAAVMVSQCTMTAQEAYTGDVQVTVGVNTDGAVQLQSEFVRRIQPLMNSDFTITLEVPVALKLGDTLVVVIKKIATDKTLSPLAVSAMASQSSTAFCKLRVTPIKVQQIVPAVEVPPAQGAADPLRNYRWFNHFHGNVGGLSVGEPAWSTVASTYLRQPLNGTGATRVGVLQVGSSSTIINGITSLKWPAPWFIPAAGDNCSMWFKTGTNVNVRYDFGFTNNNGVMMQSAAYMFFNSGVVTLRYFDGTTNTDATTATTLAANTWFKVTVALTVDGATVKIWDGTTGVELISLSVAGRTIAGRADLWTPILNVSDQNPSALQRILIEVDAMEVVLAPRTYLV